MKDKTDAIPLVRKYARQLSTKECDAVGGGANTIGTSADVIEQLNESGSGGNTMNGHASYTETYT